MWALIPARNVVRSRFVEIQAASIVPINAEFVAMAGGE